MAEELCRLGCDTTHVRDLGLRSAGDDIVFAEAAKQQRIVVSRDADFGRLLAESGATSPSVVYIRGSGLNDPALLAIRIQKELSSHTEEIASGVIVTIDSKRTRVRKLPIA